MYDWEAEELWKWIRMVELKFTMKKNVEIPDKYCKFLLLKLEKLLPDLKENSPSKYKALLKDDFINKMEYKLIYQVHENDQRFILFDFLKNLLHEVLLDDEDCLKNV